MNKFEQADTPIMTPEEQESLDKVLAEREAQKREIEKATTLAETGKSAEETTAESNGTLLKFVGESFFIAPPQGKTWEDLGIQE